MFPPHLLKNVIAFLDSKSLLRMRAVCQAATAIFDDIIIARRPPITVADLRLRQPFTGRSNDIIEVCPMFSSIDWEQDPTLLGKMFVLAAIKRAKTPEVELVLEYETIQLSRMSLAKLEEFLTDLKPFLVGMTVESLIMDSHVPRIVQIASTFLEGSTVRNQAHDIYVPMTNESRDVLLDFIGKFDSDKIEISPDQQPLPYDLLIGAADTKEFFLVQTRNVKHSIPQNTLISLVGNMFSRSCRILDVTDTLTISMADAERILHLILAMDKVVFFAATINVPPNYTSHQHGSIVVEIRRGGCQRSAMPIVEIKHLDMVHITYDEYHRH